MILKITKRTGANFDFITAKKDGVKEVTLTKVVKQSDEVGNTFSGSDGLTDFEVAFDGLCDADFDLSVDTNVVAQDNLGNVYFQIIEG